MKKTNNKYYTIFENLHDPVFVLNTEMEMVDSNPAAKILLERLDIQSTTNAVQFIPGINDKLNKCRPAESTDMHFESAINFKDGREWFQISMIKPISS